MKIRGGSGRTFSLKLFLVSLLLSFLLVSLFSSSPPSTPDALSFTLIPYVSAQETVGEHGAEAVVSLEDEEEADEEVDGVGVGERGHRGSGAVNLHYSDFEDRILKGGKVNNGCSISSHSPCMRAREILERAERRWPLV